MTTKNIIEGLTILEKYRAKSEGCNIGAGHDKIYACSTDQPVSDDGVKRLVELGWFQQGVETGDDEFTAEHYDAEEGWSCFV